MNWLQRFRSLFLLDENGTSRKKLNMNLIILLGAGIFLIIFSSLFSFGGSESAGKDLLPDFVDPPDTEDEETDLIKSLSAILNEIQGVSNVSVFVTMDSGSGLVLALNKDGSQKTTTEDDGQGGTRVISEDSWRDEHVIVRDPQGGERPVVLVEKKETYRGALVVANGVEDPRVKAQVVEAVSSLLALPTHRITVLPRG